MAPSRAALLQTDCPDLHLLARGKVRDIYALADRDDALLFVATDRVSAFDVIMKTGIPSKGKLLTELSAFWFHLLADVVPNHLITCNIDEMPASVQRYRDQLEGRSMLVRKCEVLKCEAIVREYLTGSAYAEYQKKGTIHGIKLPAGLPESAKLPEAIFTPSTKADVGGKDENIHPDQLASLLPSQPPQLAQTLVETALRIFHKASQHAATADLILADTKFEFGLLPSSTPNAPPTLLLIDEALTPDSSRFWPAQEWAEGKRMTGFDKQYLRRWLKEGDGAKAFGAGEAVEIPDDIVQQTWQGYCEAFRRLTGRDFRE